VRTVSIWAVTAYIQCNACRVAADSKLIPTCQAARYELWPWAWIYVVPCYDSIKKTRRILGRSNIRCKVQYLPRKNSDRLRYPDGPGDLTSREVTRIDKKWILNYDYWTQHILGQRPAHEPNQWGESLEQQIWVKSSWPRPSSCSHGYVPSLLIHITVLAKCEFMRL
jgi:hypothetical protein